MQAELTLSLDKEVIEQAKDFSRRQHKSLSKLVGNYPRLVSGQERKDAELTPIVANFRGFCRRMLRILAGRITPGI